MTSCLLGRHSYRGDSYYAPTLTRRADIPPGPGPHPALCGLTHPNSSRTTTRGKNTTSLDSPAHNRHPGRIAASALIQTRGRLACADGGSSTHLATCIFKGFNLVQWSHTHSDTYIPHLTSHSHLYTHLSNSRTCVAFPAFYATLDVFSVGLSSERRRDVSIGSSPRRASSIGVGAAARTEPLRPAPRRTGTADGLGREGRALLLFLGRRESHAHGWI